MRIRPILFLVCRFPISLFLISLPALCDEPLEPAAAIDFSQALHVKPHHQFAAIGALGATPTGPMVSHGGGCDGYDPGMARADRTGANITRIDFPATFRNGAGVIPVPDGSWWLETSSGPGFPGFMPCPPPGSPPMHGGLPTAGPERFIPASAGLGGSTNSPIQNYDLFASDGKHLESFREMGAGWISHTAGIAPAHIIPGANRIALVSSGLVRIGHVANGGFVADREWHISGGFVVVPLEGDQFAVVNRFSGEFNVIDPATPDTHMVETNITSKNRLTAPLIAGADGSIWLLVRGLKGNASEVVQFAPNGKVLSRDTLRLPADFRPFKFAVSGRDVYLAGFSATVYRYELPARQ